MNFIRRFDLTRVHCQFLFFCVLYFFVIGLVGLCCKPQPLVIIIIIINPDQGVPVHQAATGTDTRAGWEGNRRSGIALALRHRQWFAVLVRVR